MRDDEIRYVNSLCELKTEDAWFVGLSGCDRYIAGSVGCRPLETVSVRITVKAEWYHVSLASLHSFSGMQGFFVFYTAM